MLVSLGLGGGYCAEEDGEGTVVEGRTPHRAVLESQLLLQARDSVDQLLLTGGNGGGEEETGGGLRG